jgi:hypothetical protein
MIDEIEDTASAPTVDTPATTEEEKPADSAEEPIDEPVAQAPIMHAPALSSEESAAQAEQSQALNAPVGMQVIGRDSPHDVPTRVLSTGTVVEIAGEKITLLASVPVTYPSALNEQHFVGIAQASGNFEANRKQIKLRYGVDAVLLPLDDQFDYPDTEGMSEAEAEAAIGKTRNSFIATLSEEEAAKFGISAAVLSSYKEVFAAK